MQCIDAYARQGGGHDADGGDPCAGDGAGDRAEAADQEVDAAPDEEREERDAGGAAEGGERGGAGARRQVDGEAGGDGGGGGERGGDGQREAQAGERGEAEQRPRRGRWRAGRAAAGWRRRGAATASAPQAASAA